MKRGLSQIVAVVLIVLITISAAVSVWVVSRKIIKPDKIQSAELYISEDYTTNYKNGIVSVSLNRGVDKSDLIMIDFIFYTKDKTLIFTSANIPNANEQKVYWFDFSKIGKPDYVSVAPVFILNGKLVMGDAGPKVAIYSGDKTKDTEGLEFVPLYNELILEKNILKNGDFEYGLQCYAPNIPNYNGYATYRFSSTQGISGNAIKIECYGNDCINYVLNGQIQHKRASISTDEFYSPAGKEYIWSFYYKCTLNMQLTAQALSTQNTFANAVYEVSERPSCDGTWKRFEKEFAFKNEKARLQVLATVKTGTENPIGQNFIIDNMILKYKEGDILQTNLKYEGERDVKLSSVFYVDNKPFFPLLIWGVPYEKLEEVKSWGANSVLSASNLATEDCFNTKEGDYMDKAYKLGINIVGESTMTARLGDLNLLKNAIERFSNHKSIIAWNIADEPDHFYVIPYQIEADVLKQEYNVAKQATNLPIYSTMYRTYPYYPGETYESIIAYESQYKDSLDFWMIEPHINNLHDFDTMTKRMDVLKQAGPKYTWVDLFPYIGEQTDTDLVERGYWAVINGGKGITIDGYPTIMERESERLPLVKKLFSELQELDDIILLGEDVTSQFSSESNGFGFIALRYNNKVYILSVNTNQDYKSITFTSDLISGKEISVEDRAISPNGNSFTDNFDGIERHVYIIG